MICRMPSDILLRLPDNLLLAVQEEWHVRKYKTRSETIRALLAEALRRAAIRRKKGLPVEVGE